MAGSDDCHSLPKHLPSYTRTLYPSGTLYLVPTPYASPLTHSEASLTRNRSSPVGQILCQSLVPRFPLFFLFHLPPGVSGRQINEINALPGAWGLTYMVGSRSKDACVNTVSSEASFIDPVHVAVWGGSAEPHNVGILHSACKLHPSRGQGMRLLAKNPGHKVQNPCHQLPTEMSACKLKEAWLLLPRSHPDSCCLYFLSIKPCWTTSLDLLKISSIDFQIIATLSKRRPQWLKISSKFIGIPYGNYRIIMKWLPLGRVWVIGNPRWETRIFTVLGLYF